MNGKRIDKQEHSDFGSLILQIILACLGYIVKTKTPLYLDLILIKNFMLWTLVQGNQLHSWLLIFLPLVDLEWLASL